MISQQDRIALWRRWRRDLPYVWSQEAASVSLKNESLRCALNQHSGRRSWRTRLVSNYYLHWAGGVLYLAYFVKRNRTVSTAAARYRGSGPNLVAELAGSYNDRVIAQVINSSAIQPAWETLQSLPVAILRNYHQFSCFDDSKRGLV